VKSECEVGKTSYGAVLIFRAMYLPLGVV